MGKSTPSAPPSYSGPQMANAQANSNVRTAAANSYMNAINQTGPYGSVKWTQTNSRQIGDGTESIPEWSVSTEMSPEQKAIYDRQTALSTGALDLGTDYLSKIRDATATPFNYEGLPAAPTAPVYDAAYRQHAYDTILQRADPQLQRDQRALEQRLADQGVGLQDPAYRTAMDQYQRGINDFRLGADLQSQQMAANDFNTAAQGFNLQGAARDRAIAERLQQRTQPISEFAQMLGFGGAGVRQPQFVNTQQQPIANTDVVGAYGTANQMGLQQQQMAMQQNNAMLGGLFGLGSAGLMAYGMGGRGRG